MKKLLLLAMAVILTASLAGCGGDDHHNVVVRSLSDINADGDIAFTPPSTFTFSQDIIPRPTSLLFGVDGAGTEFQAFMDFPLDGSTGGGIVPLGATIVAADIEVFIRDVRLSSAVPTLIDLVTFPITHLRTTDFNSTPLATLPTFDFFNSDIGNFVRIDVTPLLQEAQRQGFNNFQIRFLRDFVTGVGIVEIEDSADVSTAPILTVEYF